MLWLGLLLAVNGPHPAYATAAPLWGELKPADVVTIAMPRDHTAFDDAGGLPFFSAQFSVAVEPWGQTLLEAHNTGLSLWDLSANPKNPPHLGGFSQEVFPKVPPVASQDFYITDVAAPQPGSSMAALAGDKGMGVILVDLSNKTMPRLAYMDGDPAMSGKSCLDVVTLTLSGKPYALAACKGPRPGIAVYDLTAAAAVTGTYQEVAPNVASMYPNVFVADGLLVTSWVDGMNTRDKIITRLDGLEHFVVTNSIQGGGFDLWDFATPSAPKRLGGGGGIDAYGPIALWKTGAKYYVASSTQTQQLQLYDVTDVLVGTATMAGPKLSWTPTPRQFDNDTRLYFSRAADGTGFVSYASNREPAHDATSVALVNEELLFDVSDPKVPREITPEPQSVNGDMNSYWGFSYQFGWVRAGGGRFAGSFFYRSATGELDIHQWTPPANRPPVVTSSPPTTATVNRAYDYQIVASDPEGKPLTFTKVMGPAGMTFLGAGELSWVPMLSDVGAHAVSISVSDGKSAVLHDWMITVAEPGV